MTARATIRWREHPEMEEFMLALVPGHTEAEIRAAFQDRFGIALTEGQIGNFKHRHGVVSGTHGGCFKRGQEPWNKGRAMAEWMPPESIERSKAGRFQKGLMPHNALSSPVGTERVSKDGYVEVKVSERPSGSGPSHDNWVGKHRLVWERSHGRRVPDGHAVIFCDGDRRNFDPENLLLVSRAELSMMNRSQHGWGDRETAEAARDLARLNLGIADAEKRPRRCSACGAEFKPEYKHQRRCRACIDAGVKAPRHRRKR